jgi:hypothetical protein
LFSPSLTPKVVTPTVEAVTEQSPLLPPSPTLIEPDEENPSPVEPEAQNPHKYIWGLCFIIFALVQASDSLLRPPLIQLKELSGCRSHYGEGWSLGRDCKVEEVQHDLATLIGWQQLFDTAPGVYDI